MVRVLIIGAGPSGLAAIKVCLEDGHEPVCVEQEGELGGVWRYTSDERHSSVYKYFFFFFEINFFVLNL